MAFSREGQAIPRLVADAPFPPYSYVPGLWPHPTSDPAGHHFSVEPVTPGALDPERWQANRTYLLGIDLFNHGYYWEAHEVWESLWHACGRAGTMASFLKGLIKLAAAGVKVREDKPVGVRGHARRAVELFEQVASEAGMNFMGLSLAVLLGFARSLSGRQSFEVAHRAAPVQVVLDLVLLPGEQEMGS